MKPIAVTRYKGREWYYAPREELERLENKQKALIAFALKHKHNRQWHSAFGWERYGKTGT